MRNLPRTLLLVAAAFAGGAATAHFASATPEAASPYSPFDQLARVLVIIENYYVDPAQRSKIVEGAMKGMMAELDPHSAYMSPAEYALFTSQNNGRFAGIGIEVDGRGDLLTVIAPIEGSPAERAGIRAGDQIITVDGQPMQGERIDKLVTVLRGPPSSRVRLVIRRPGVADPLTFELERAIVHVKSVVAKRLAGDVAYLRIKQFQEGTHDEVLAAAAEVRKDGKAALTGVILDMRNNPGGLVEQAEAVADEFLASGGIYSTRHRGEIVDSVTAHAGGAFASMPVVVLVNEGSASAAELVAGALQDNGRATIVGATTFGKGSVQTIIDLPEGAGLRLTTMRYYTPSGHSIQAEGIHPDVVIRPAGAHADVIRESDYAGHLAPGGFSRPAPARAPQVVIEAKQPENTSDEAAKQGAKDIPVEPEKGSDFTLSVGYQTLKKLIAAHH
jgi:carboxyl-terminal processing protease